MLSAVIFAAFAATGFEGNCEMTLEANDYTFPELVTSTRVPSSLSTRTMANFATLLGLRHDVEVRYAPDRRYVTSGQVPAVSEYGDILSKPDLSSMCAGVPQREVQKYLCQVCEFARSHGKFLLRGRFVNTEGFSVDGTGVQAKGYRADDGTFAVLVWNTDRECPSAVSVQAPGTLCGVYEPGRKDPVDLKAPLAADSLRLFVYRQAHPAGDFENPIICDDWPFIKDA